MGDILQYMYNCTCTNMSYQFLLEAKLTYVHVNATSIQCIFFRFTAVS